MNTTKNTEFYNQNMEYALANNEIEKYKYDIKLNKECVNDIEQAIMKSQYERNFYDLKKAVNIITTKYGLDRPAHLIAKLIQQSDHDTRFSKANKQWAHQFQPPHTMRNTHARTHNTLIDGFATQLRKAKNSKA